ncbi:hypothetical protein M3697_06945 [Janibacter melonis]|uniref:hypothetical protein n=1 Tax=Janibacter melonis TaxID=262209 RepID=UPI00204388F1|nr:hypothetical protein [Janibacter melonis]MCM3554841.1 hypothetical protein [Janibacter melonis]
MTHPLDRTRSAPSALAAGSAVAPIVVGGLLLVLAGGWWAYALVAVDEMTTSASQLVVPGIFALAGAAGLVYGLLVLAAKVQESHALLLQAARARDAEVDRAGA